MTEIKQAEILKPFGEYNTPRPNEETIELLQTWLELAKGGEIVGVAIVGCKANGAIATNWSAGSAHCLLLAGGVAHLQFRLHRMLDE